jgi:hypothetical protein
MQWLAAGAALALLLAGSSLGHAGVLITSPGGQYAVGIGSLGNLELSSDHVFVRTSDGFDPIRPGVPREAWGVSANGIGGYADTANSSPPFKNLVNNGAPIYNANTAFISTFLQDASLNNLLRIDQSYSFAAPNVLAIHETITNVSGVVQSTLFSRNVDWDFSSSNNDLSTVDPLTGPIIQSSFGGFDTPDPTASFAFDAGPGGGKFGPADIGGGMRIDLGNLAPGASSGFTIYHALNFFGQPDAALRTQLTGLGADFIITGDDPADPFGVTRSAAMAFAPDNSAAPEPGSLVLLGLGLLSLGGYAWRRKKLGEFSEDRRCRCGSTSAPA